MRRVLKRIGLIFMLTAFAAPFAACDDDDGPAEEVGEDIDEAVDDID